MTMLQIDNMLINSDDIILATFTPEYTRGEEFDSISGQTINPQLIPAKLTITTSAQVLEADYAYDGDPLGYATVSKIETFRGQIAESIWLYLQQSSINVLSWADKQMRDSA